MIVLVAQLHSASSRGISEGLHTPYVLIRPESTIIGTLLFIGGDAHDGLGDVVLTIGPDCVDSGFFLCLHLMVKRVSPVSKKESTRRCAVTRSKREKRTHTGKYVRKLEYCDSDFHQSDVDESSRLF